MNRVYKWIDFFRRSFFHKKESSGTLLLILGPLLFLATLLLFGMKASYLMESPVWLFNFGISTLLTCGITFFSIKERISLEKDLRHESHLREKEASDMRGILDETHILYRSKVDKLEEKMKTLSLEHNKQLVHKGKALEDLQKSYEQLFNEALQHKNHVVSLKGSLEDALDELRKLRQEHYLLQEKQAEFPTDVSHKYKQLRAQFEEKSTILEQTRRDLFALEGRLTVLSKEKEEQTFEAQREQEILWEMLKNLEEENQFLEQEVLALEQVVTTEQPKKKPLRTKKGSPIEEMLELQFEAAKE